MAPPSQSRGAHTVEEDVADIIGEQTAKTWELLSWEGELQWMTKSPSGVVSGGRAYSSRELAALAANAAERKLDAYVSLNPVMRCGIKASKRHVIAWRYTLVDVDPDEHGGGAGLGYAKFAGYCIDTGRGMHAWIPLAEPLVIDGGDTDMWWNIESSTREFLNTITPSRGHIDYRCANLDRVVRLPGSINQRNGRMAHFVGDQSRYPPLAAHEFIDLYPPKAPPQVMPKLDVDFSNLTPILPHLKDIHRRFLLRGVSTERHSALFATLKALHELGCPLDQAEIWIRAGAAFSDLDDEPHIQRTLKQVYG